MTLLTTEHVYLCRYHHSMKYEFAENRCVTYKACSVSYDNALMHFGCSLYLTTKHQVKIKVFNLSKACDIVMERSSSTSHNNNNNKSLSFKAATRNELLGLFVRF